MDNTQYKILLIEDNELDQKAFERFVIDDNIPYEYSIADSVSEASQILNSNQFDAVISDHSIGDGTVFDILKIINNTPTIVVTGAGDEETAGHPRFNGQHDTGKLPTRSDFNQSLIRLSGIGRNDKLYNIQTVLVDGGLSLRILPRLHENLKVNLGHAQMKQFIFY